jgi:hypothetical protein
MAAAALGLARKEARSLNGCLIHRRTPLVMKQAFSLPPIFHPQGVALASIHIFILVFRRMSARHKEGRSPNRPRPWDANGKWLASDHWHFMGTAERSPPLLVRLQASPGLV